MSQPGVSMLLREEEAMASPYLATGIVPLGWMGVSGTFPSMRSGRRCRPRTPTGRHRP